MDYRPCPGLCGGGVHRRRSYRDEDMDDTGEFRAACDRLDLLLVGTGAEAQQLTGHFRNTLTACRIDVEAMPTPAACRTYKFLLAEGRRVAVALMPV